MHVLDTRVQATNRRRRPRRNELYIYMPACIQTAYPDSIDPDPSSQYAPASVAAEHGTHLTSPRTLA